jgi:shikimate 5-dehydrogenase
MTQPTDTEILDAADGKECHPGKYLTYDGEWRMTWQIVDGDRIYRGTLREVVAAWIEARKEATK